MGIGRNGKSRSHQKALDLGINFLTQRISIPMVPAKKYWGKALNDFAPRDEIVVATKLYSKMKKAPIAVGFHAKRSF